MKFKTDSITLGILLGLITPIIAFFGYYLLNFRHMGISKYFDYLSLGNIYTPVISLCVIANLAVFYIFLQTNKYYSARGVILSTFIYAALVLALKIFI